MGAERMRNNNQEKDREREQAVRRQKRQSASEKGLLGFFLFWGAILAKLYLPSSAWGSDHVSSSKSQVSHHTVEDVTLVKTPLPPTQKLPHHPQARIQPQSRQMQPSDHRWSADLNDD